MVEDNRKEQDKKKDELTEKDLEQASGGAPKAAEGHKTFEGGHKIFEGSQKH